MGLYFSLMEWYNPLYMRDDKSQYVENYMIPQIKELVTRYQPSLFWPDGEWLHRDTMWRSEELLAWLYNNVQNYEEFTVNDRWGSGLRGHSGDYYTTEYGRIGGGSDGMVDSKPFEECRGIGKSFGLNRIENYDDYLTRERLIQMFIKLVSQGGNLLLNIGPHADGTIPVIMQDRLIALGEWLDVNGEAIYGTRKSLFKELAWGVSTTKGQNLYLHLFKWPEDHCLKVPGVHSKVAHATLLHDRARTPLKIRADGETLHIDLMGYHPHPHASVIALEMDSTPKIVH